MSQKQRESDTENSGQVFQNDLDDLYGTPDDEEEEEKKEEKQDD